MGTRSTAALAIAAATAVATAGGISDMATAGQPAGRHDPTAGQLDSVCMIEYAPSQYDWCYYAANDQDYFAEEGIDIEDDPLQVGTDADLNRAILSGEGAGTTPIRDGALSRDALIASAYVIQEAGQIDADLDVADVVDAFIDPTVVEEALDG